MGSIMSRKRPWLAALLTVFMTGLGHLYLRRWLRALGWIAFAIATATFFVPPSALDMLAAGTPPALTDVAPLLTVSILSIIDAYFTAVLVNQQATQNDSLTCPACRRTIDPDLDFCQWCTTSLDTDSSNESA